MFGFLSGLTPTILGIVLITSTVAAYIGGWKTRDVFCDAAAAQIQAQLAQDRVNSLQRQITAAHDADTALKNRTAQDKEALEKIQGTLDGITQKISTSDCFTSADVDRLRDLWGPSNNAPGVPPQR